MLNRQIVQPLNRLCHFECPGEAGMYREVVFIQLLAVSRWLLAFLRIWDLGIGIWLRIRLDWAFLHAITLSFSHSLTPSLNKPFPVLRATFSEKPPVNLLFPDFLPHRD